MVGEVKLGHDEQKERGESQDHPKVMSEAKK